MKALILPPCKLGLVLIIESNLWAYSTPTYQVNVKDLANQAIAARRIGRRPILQVYDV